MQKVDNFYADDRVKAQAKVSWRPTVSHLGVCVVGERAHGQACITTGTTSFHPFTHIHAVAMTLNGPPSILSMQSPHIHSYTHRHTRTDTHTHHSYSALCVQMSD